MGKNDEVGQLKPTKCTYSTCNKRFDTEKEMKYHKLAEPDHFYCKKCDVDCKDDRDLKGHKVAAMQPWVEGRMKQNKDESPKHIVCEFCGMDFKSFGGRKIHREQTHQADQHIECPWCKTVFTRANNYVAHFEMGKCTEITRRQFLGYVQQKHVNKEIMKAPEEFRENIQINQQIGANPGLIEDRSDVPDIEEGGVNLLDDEDEQQHLGIQPLKAESNLIEMTERPQLTQRNLEKWPRLPTQELTQFTESWRKLSISSSITETGSERMSIHESRMSGSGLESQITSRRGGNKVYMESLTSLNSPQNVTLSEVDETASEASTTRASFANGSAAWTTGSTSQILFKGVKPTPPCADWNVVLQRRAEESQVPPTTNLLRSRFWDPTSKEFDLNIFRNGMTEKYHCPFDGCQDAVYDIDVDLIGHLQHAHLKTRYRCPLCLKIFNSASALIGHSESAGKCKVKKSSVYGKLLDEVSGGFLSVENLQEPSIAKEKDGTLATGIMNTKFTAKMPYKH